MYSKPVETHYGTADKAVTDKPTLVYWIFSDIAVLGTIGTIYIRDGYSTSAPIVAKISSGYSRLSPFYPPIRCAHGLYVDKDTHVTSFTVGYREEKDIYPTE